MTHEFPPIGFVGNYIQFGFSRLFSQFNSIWLFKWFTSPSFIKKKWFTTPSIVQLFFDNIRNYTYYHRLEFILQSTSKWPRSSNYSIFWI